MGVNARDLYQQVEKHFLVVEGLVVDSVLLHTLNQAFIVFFALRLNTNQSGARFPVVFFGVFKMGDVIGWAQHVVEEFA